MPDHAESGTFPRGNETIDAVLAVETDHQCIFFQDAVHLITSALQLFVGFVTGNTAPGTVTKPDQIRGIGEDEINSAIRKGGHNIDAVTQDKTGHRDTSWLQGAPRRTSVRRPFPAPGACTPGPVAGQADRGITSRQSPSPASLCRESGLKGTP